MNKSCAADTLNSCLVIIVVFSKVVRCLSYRVFAAWSLTDSMSLLFHTGTHKTFTVCGTEERRTGLRWGGKGEWKGNNGWWGSGQSKNKHKLVSADWQPITSIQGSETFTAGEGQGGCRVPEQSTQGQDRGGVADYTQNHTMLHRHVMLFPSIYRLDRTFNMLKHGQMLWCCWCRGPLIPCGLSDEILNSGHKESGRLGGSSSQSLWLRSRAQQRLHSHLYSCRNATCIPSNVLSLLRGKTDTLWAGGVSVFPLYLSFSCLSWILTPTWVFVRMWHGWLHVQFVIREID